MQPVSFPNPRFITSLIPRHSHEYSSLVDNQLSQLVAVEKEMLKH